MTSWLSRGSGSFSEKEMQVLSRREFSFTLEDDIYVRYQSFSSANDFESTVCKNNPCKIDIGAVYNIRPSTKNAVSSFFPVQREFVFDIDMTDYDDMRQCCSEANICLLCWPLMTAAIKVVHAALQEDFGFQHILWVYSGRRGVHCWVSDVSASKFDNEQRGKFSEYFQVYSGHDNAKAKVNLAYPLHASLERAYNILEPMFDKICIHNQGIMDDHRWRDVLVYVPEEYQDDITKILSKCRTPSDRWVQLKVQIESLGDKHRNKPGSSNQVSKQFALCLPSIVFTYLYPRLDINVSKQTNHLLKSPFCVHPKTGRVCVPIDPYTCEEFDPFKVPTLVELNEELNAADGTKSSMTKFIEYFETKFLKPLEAYHLQESRLQSAASISF